MHTFLARAILATNLVVIMSAVALSGLVSGSISDAATFSSNQSYNKDTYNHRGARYTRVNHGGWFNSGGAWAFNTWSIEAYTNIYHNQSEFYYAGFYRSSYGFPTQLHIKSVNLTFYNTPQFPMQTYYDFIDTQSDVYLLTGVTNGETALLWAYATAWDEVTAPYHTSNLYGSGSGTYTAFP